jgi:hypothetical protein
MKKPDNKIECQFKIPNINKNISTTNTLFPSIASLLEVVTITLGIDVGVTIPQLMKT